MPAIRIAKSGDAPQISALVCALADALLVDPEGDEAQDFYAVMEPSRVAKNMEKQDRFYLVAEVAGQLVGMILILNNNYVGQFFVHVDHQGKGVGALLWRAALFRAKRLGGDGAFTVKSSLAAESVYQHFGFEPTAPADVDSGFRYIPMRRGPSLGDQQESREAGGLSDESLSIRSAEE